MTIIIAVLTERDYQHLRYKSSDTPASPSLTFTFPQLLRRIFFYST